ncbi:MAG: SMI1/KNR4 family protein [Desulfocapsaceae bacterium]|nr:SMI1/KNR4 family protein [Desulfocapsaceae bacterium]
MKIFIIVAVVTAIIASIYYYFLYKYIKSKFEKTAENHAAEDTDFQAIDYSRGHDEAEQPVSEQEIADLEAAMGKKLPNFYKSFLMHYPTELLQLGAPYNTVSDLSLPNTTARIAELNSLEFVPADILVIGEDGMGNLYYTQLNDNDGVIYLFNHEEPIYQDVDEEVIDWHTSWEMKFHNLDEMISYLQESLAE